MQAAHVGQLPEQLMQRMLHQLRIRRFAEVECIGDLLVAVRSGKRDRSDELHGVFLSLLVVVFVVLLVLRGVGSSGHRSMRTTGRMMTLQHGPPILPLDLRQRSRGNAMIMAGRTRAGRETRRLS